MSHFQNHIAGLSIAILLLCGCSATELRGNKHFPKEIWPRKEPAVFQVIPCHTGAYLPTIWIRHSSNYLYQDVHCLLTISQGHLAILTDTLHFTTTNANGNWNGQGLQGLKTLTLPLSHSVPLDSACHYQITIQHLMADDTLLAVKDAGFLLELQTQNK